MMSYPRIEIIQGILDRKQAGIDCSEDESCEILRFLDEYPPTRTKDGRVICHYFPLERDQWYAELEAGDRPQVIR
jgi:hypothetical protein